MPSSLGPAEILVVLVVALIVLGPARLPQAGRQIGKAIAEVRRWSASMQSEIRDVFDAQPEEDRVWVPTPAQAPPIGGAPTNGSAGPDAADATVVTADPPAPGGTADPPGAAAAPSPVASLPVPPVGGAPEPAVDQAPVPPVERAPEPPVAGPPEPPPGTSPSGT